MQANLPLDFLPKNSIQAISWEKKQLQATQEADPLTRSLKQFLAMQELSHGPQLQSTIRTHKKDSFFEDRLIWKQIK
jgi:hypothetical protein